MKIITSRKAHVPVLSRRDSMLMVEPAMNVLYLLTSTVYLPDDTQFSIARAYELIENTLGCFSFFDQSVMVMPTLLQHDIPYDVVVKPVEPATFVSFRVTFHIQP